MKKSLDFFFLIHEIAVVFRIVYLAYTYSKSLLTWFEELIFWGKRCVCNPSFLQKTQGEAESYWSILYFYHVCVLYFFYILWLRLTRNSNNHTTVLTVVSLSRFSRAFMAFSRLRIFSGVRPNSLIISSLKKLRLP